MNPIITEQVRLSTLRYCAQATRIGMTLPLLLQCIRAEGVNIAPDELDRQIRYLVGKGFLAPAPKQLSPENASYLVTAEGEDFIAVNMTQ